MCSRGSAREVHIPAALHATFSTGKQAIKYTFTQPTLLTLTLSMVVFSLAVTGVFQHAYQPYVVEVGLPPPYLGIALSIAGFLSMFGLNYSQKIVKCLGGNRRARASCP